MIPQFPIVVKFGLILFPLFGGGLKTGFRKSGWIHGLSILRQSFFNLVKEPIKKRRFRDFTGYPDAKKRFRSYKIPHYHAPHAGTGYGAHSCPRIFW